MLKRFIVDSRGKRFTGSSEARSVEVYGNIEHWIKAGWKMEVGKKKWRGGESEDGSGGGGTWSVKVAAAGLD